MAPTVIFWSLNFSTPPVPNFGSSNTSLWPEIFTFEMNRIYFMVANKLTIQKKMLVKYMQI